MANPILKAVCRAMERIAPLRLAESWDNVGLLLESPVQNLAKKRVLLTIDLTTSVLSEALANDTSVIVSYHPPIFKGLQSLTLKNPLQSSLMQCAANGISIYSPHTALDSVWGGVNDWLAEGVLDGKENGTVSSLVGDKVSAEGVKEGGEGRLVTLHSSISMSVLESRIKKQLKLSQIQVGYPTDTRSTPIRTIAICAGSGGSMLVGKKADVYFTGEMSHHEVLAAVAAGTHVILCGHTNTERGYLPVLASKLRHELERDVDQDPGVAGVEVVVSQNDQHPLQFV
ncbi:putative NIF3 (NGG1p interacting factor 3) [Lyophyllum shimeji]|uniref:NIF3 (NGG1p interacting factor 3) n=1 Tax=Lyophyllum shimeji TaxID=47721 RepID=A0A9P3PVK6_LYOSH|nr:putative NIF3 (NGG1p interacting factor 3) [Lyophyllum shimeji]GLB45940.1 putative NIF3 (NGG1p interacting factor 3) [Lyophyllum shimeji]